jgi:hypothetical protein
MIMRTERFPQYRAVNGAVLVLAMAMTMARVKSTRKPVRKEPGTGMVQQMGRVMRSGSQLRKGRGRERERVKGQVLLYKPQEEMISLEPLVCCCRRK